MRRVSIEQLWIYPVKSLAGIPVTSAQLTATGLQGDREWMLVDAAGRFVSQRQLPQMATIKPEITDDRLILHNAQGQSVDIGETDLAVSVRIWRDTCVGLCAPPPVNDWLTQSLQSAQPLRLVRFDTRHSRALDEQRFGAHHTHFADGAPYLVASMASLQALNTHLLLQQQMPVDALRFRANIVISGLPAFAEHHFSFMQTSDAAAILALKDHCQRCSIITVDPYTGTFDAKAHPFRALAEINSMPNNPKAPAFGVNAVLSRGEARTIRVGERWLVTGSAAEPV